MTQSFLDGRVLLHSGDCRDVLKTLADCSIDSVVTDPPYHLQSIVKRFGGKNAAPVKVSEFYKESGESKGSSPYKRSSSGFMGKQWDGGDIAFDVELWAEVLRVLKPGGYILAFSSSRTYHRMACAIEDAGFVTHPMIGWIFGTGFPKAHSVSKHIDRMAGAEREVIGKSERHVSGKPNQRTNGLCDSTTFAETIGMGSTITAPSTDAAKQWDGWFYGAQSLKPALEPIYMGQKPFSEKTGTANVLKWGTGAINVDGCRVPSNGDIKPHGSANRANTIVRWPANLIHDGSDEVLAAFPDSAGGNSGGAYSKESVFFDSNDAPKGFGDSGSAARFFYCAKADKRDRAGSSHPTVKPLDLIQWLVRLVTPKGGTVLDLFAGTGTTAEACVREGMRAVLIERDAEYCGDIERRMGMVSSGHGERAREGAKARGRADDAGPLFEGIGNEHFA